MTKRLAEQHFQNEDPIGKRLTQSSSGTPSYEIVGVVRHVEHNNLDGQASRTPQFYSAFNQIPPDRLPGSVRRINLLTRTEVEPSSLAPAVRAEIAALNKDQAVFNVRTMEQIVSQSVAPRRFSMLLLSVFAVVALALASIGIYGMMSYAVAQRTREIGLRMTLGAQRGNVLRLVIGQGMKLALVGVALGLVASVALTSNDEKSTVRRQRHRSDDVCWPRAAAVSDCSVGLLGPRATSDEGRSNRGAQVRIKPSLLDFFSVKPLCSLCLCGRFFKALVNHRGTENTEVSQRRAVYTHFGQSFMTQKLHGLVNAGTFAGTVSRNLIDLRRIAATAASTCSGDKAMPV